MSLLLGFLFVCLFFLPWLEPQKFLGYLMPENKWSDWFIIIAIVMLTGPLSCAVLWAS